MKTPRVLASTLIFTAVTVAPAWAASATSKATSDLVLPQKRQETVDKATHLTRTPAAAPVPENLPQPFNPAGFDAPEDVPPTPGPNPDSNRRENTPKAATGPVGDRDLLEAIAARIQPTGSLVVPGRPPLLTFPGAKRVRVGDVITVTFNEREYDIEVTAIDGSNFTLRYRGVEFTRPIKTTTK